MCVYKHHTHFIEQAVDLKFKYDLLIKLHGNDAKKKIIKHCRT